MDSDLRAGRAPGAPSEWTDAAAGDLPAAEWALLDEAEWLDAPAPGKGSLTYVADVRLVHTNRIVTVDAGDLALRRNALVIAETERGLCLGRVVREARCVRVTSPPMRILRLASDEDVAQESRNEGREREAFRFCWQRVRERRLPMKLVKVEYLHGGNKAVFYFSADGRVDFRELVKDLAYRLRTRVELRQIGVRDASKIIGGVGPCGRELCCSSWLQRFEPVSIRMAKTQNLSLNPQKVSGVCGRLMCCLAYEQESYQALRKRLPRVGKNVTTPRGPGRVMEIDILRQRVRVALAEGALVEFEGAQVHGDASTGDERDLDDVPEELRHLEDAPHEGRGRLPAEGREIQARGGPRRKPWQGGARSPERGGASPASPPADPREPATGPRKPPHTR
jgi:cell fate regulator YaaT (PSP1 superfamily)